MPVTMPMISKNNINILNNLPKALSGLFLKNTLLTSMMVMGEEKGTAWLKDNTPKLLQFYQQHVNPALENYMKEHQFEQHIDNSRPSQTAQWSSRIENERQKGKDHSGHGV